MIGLLSRHKKGPAIAYRPLDYYSFYRLKLLHLDHFEGFSLFAFGAQHLDKVHAAG